MTTQHKDFLSGYPLKRGRRNRRHAGLRRLVSETSLNPSDFIAPMFITEGKDIMDPILSMPGYYRMSLDLAVSRAAKWHELGIQAVLLFVKVPEARKDNEGTEALNEQGLMQTAVKRIKEAVPGLTVMTDVALDPYSSYGHDGIVKDGEIVNDETVDILARMAVSHARAGADYVAPSDMMDGRIGQIRRALEANNYPDTGIMAYSAKYASGFYGPFRDALDSAPGFGDKKTYQMDPANVREAVREAQMDEAEGADMVMVKPGLPYLDVVRAVRESVSVPVAVYQVSGEYAMIKAAAEKGWIDEQDAMMESLIAIKRAGADLVATYWAEDAIRLLTGSR
ncbi:porphobilinogen synthase [Balneolales bacterium ANBcel1]|nr:porphobilinogen synthase [Balneolales bacterium ANBcel1]